MKAYCRGDAVGYGAVAPSSALRTVEVTAARERQSNGKSFMVLLAGVLVLGVFFVCSSASLEVHLYPSAPSMYSKPRWHLIAQPKDFCWNHSSVCFVVHLPLWAALHLVCWKGRGKKQKNHLGEVTDADCRRETLQGTSRLACHSRSAWRSPCGFTSDR
jgi:hypothetical protein